MALHRRYAPVRHKKTRRSGASCRGFKPRVVPVSQQPPLTPEAADRLMIGMRDLYTGQIHRPIWDLFTPSEQERVAVNEKVPCGIWYHDPSSDRPGTVIAPAFPLCRVHVSLRSQGFISGPATIGEMFYRPDAIRRQLVAAHGHETRLSTWVATIGTALETEITSLLQKYIDAAPALLCLLYGTPVAAVNLLDIATVEQRLLYVEIPGVHQRLLAIAAGKDRGLAARAHRILASLVEKAPPGRPPTEIPQYVRDYECARVAEAEILPAVERAASLHREKRGHLIAEQLNSEPLSSDAITALQSTPWNVRMPRKRWGWSVAVQLAWTRATSAGRRITLRSFKVNVRKGQAAVACNPNSPQFSLR